MNAKPSRAYLKFALFGLAAVLGLLLIARREIRTRTTVALGRLVVRRMPDRTGQFVVVFQTMSTQARIRVVAPDIETAQRWIVLAVDEIEAVNAEMNAYHPKSRLSRVNRLAAEGESAKVGQSLLEVILYSQELSELSAGAFDITYTPLRDLWRRAQKQKRLPTEEEIAATMKQVGWRKLEIDAEAGLLRFKTDGMELDLGGVAKGYAIDRALKAMTAAGLEAGLVDIGGDMRVVGRAPDGPWKIGLRDPASAATGPNVPVLGRLALADAAVATSGDYERGFTVEGRHYSHIINPATGRPASDLVSATVVAPTAMEADGLATAVTVLGIESGLKLIERLPRVECLLIWRRDGKLVSRRSSGFSEYLIDLELQSYEGE